MFVSTVCNAKVLEIVKERERRDDALVERADDAKVEAVEARRG
jgi:hypothetical protein